MNRPNSLTEEELQEMNACWRAANYLSVGQIYLCDNPLLNSQLTVEHVKPRLLGHWQGEDRLVALKQPSGVEADVPKRIPTRLVMGIDSSRLSAKSS